MKGRSKKYMTFALGATAALIALAAFAGSAAAQDGNDWPYEEWEAVGYDSADVFGEPFTSGGFYAPGSTVTVKATANSSYHDPVVIDVYDLEGTKIGTKDFGPMANLTLEFDVDLPVDTPLGLCRIEANGFPTDYFTVEGVPIPEFSTVAIPVATILGLVFLLGRRGARKK